MEIRARPAAAEDLLQLEELRQHLLAGLDDRRGGPALAACLLGGEPLDRRLARARSDTACLFAGTIDGLVVGMAGATCAPGRRGASGERTVALDLLYVAPPARRVGIATELLTALSRWGTARGCTDLDAPALPGDRALKSLFESYGLRARLLMLSGPLRSPEEP